MTTELIDTRRAWTISTERSTPATTELETLDQPGSVLFAISPVLAGSAQMGGLRVQLIEGLPVALVEHYAAIARRHARLREVDPGVWVASVAGLDGAWAEGATEVEALNALPDAIVGWVAVKRRAGALDIPPLEGIDLNLPPATRNIL